jgi:acetyl esterase/lipase
MSPVTDARPGKKAPDLKVLNGLPNSDEVVKVFAPGADTADPLLSPALGDLTGFPPVFILAGGAEALMTDSIFYAERAAKAGVDVQLKIGKDMIHTYPLDFLDYPEAKEAFDEIVLFFRRHLKDI